MFPLPIISEKAKEGRHALAFWEKYGAEATKEAFKVSRATLYRWQKSLWKHRAKLEGLKAKSAAVQQATR